MLTLIIIESIVWGLFLMDMLATTGEFIQVIIHKQGNVKFIGAGILLASALFVHFLRGM